MRAGEELLLRWDRNGRPLPVRVLRRPDPGAWLVPAPPWHATGPADAPFDFCRHMRRLIADIGRRCPDFKHLNVKRILVGITSARNRLLHGLQARVTPLRFAGGHLTGQRGGTTYQVQRYFLGDSELLYLLTFCLPRFLDQDFDEKFITLFHELFHISPEFNGDLRRHGGRCYLHTHNKKVYDRSMAELARAYLAQKPEPDLFAFLRLSFSQLQKRHGGIAGVVAPRPRMFPLGTKGQERPAGAVLRLVQSWSAQDYPHTDSTDQCRVSRALRG